MTMMMMMFGWWLKTSFWIWTAMITTMQRRGGVSANSTLSANVVTYL